MSDERDVGLVGEHYGRDDLAARILEALRATAKDPDTPTIEDLAPIDQLHTRGREATLELARLVGITAGMRVLDVGGGMGGPGRAPSRASSAARWKYSTSQRSSAAPGKYSPPGPA
jgi:hypothetical protein